MNKRMVLTLVVVAALSAAAAVLVMRLQRSAPAQKQPAAAAVPASQAALLTQARAAEAQGDMEAGRAAYQQLLSEFPGSAEAMSWQKKVEELNIRLLFSPAPTAKSTVYEIKAGDTLTRIAKEFNTTVELLKRSNGLTSDMIMPGRKLKVWTAPFSIRVDKSQNTLILQSNEELVKTYLVSTGANNCTPVGTFKIVNKLPHPTWFKAGAIVPAESPENVLGTRWLGFDLAGYGIHGTVEPQSLGRQVTEGCVRMANPEVEELYDIVPVGTTVTIVD